MKFKLFLFLSLCNIAIISAQTVKGKVLDEKGEPLMGATVTITDTQKGVSTDEEGKFRFFDLSKSEFKLEISFVGYETVTKTVDLRREDLVTIHVKLTPNATLHTVEVFGERYKQPEKLDAITRMPLRPSEQIQSISVISDKVIAEQGALTVTDAIRNVPGVTLFGSYGGLNESMSIRGYRGVPILKNGVRVDSDFRTASLTSDMQGVESIQVIKGSAAVTQGIGDGLGSPGGVINVVTKTPKFVNGGEVSLRSGSWGQFRPTFDVQSVLDKNRTVAFRLNGAYERSDGFRKLVSMNQVYINPSLEWRPDDKTTITIEMDYMSRNKTPDRGTINLAGPGVEALYKMPLDQFLGFNTDNSNNKTTTYAARIVRQLADNISLRAAYFGSSYKTDITAASLDTIKGGYSNPERARSLTRSLRDDKNSTVQLDLIGRDLYTGSVKHTFQLGFDYKTTNLTTNSYGAILIDTINATGGNINNTLNVPKSVKWAIGTPVETKESSYGLMAQEVMTINQYLKAILGLRYSYQTSTGSASTGQITGDAWDPMAGVMVTPMKNINVFGSYTTTTSLRSASQLKEDGSAMGPSRSKQWEVGVKSDWLDNRLRFNFTYFNILNSNTSYGVYGAANDRTPLYYDNAGDLRRDGVEVELSGRILENLQVMLGYAYVNPKYKDSPAYKEDSSPINTTKHTANGWVYYTVNKGALKGLSAGVGAYYVGKRPSNDYTIKVFMHNSEPGVKPFDMPAYTTINAQLAYTYSKFTARVFFNNIFDELGYNSYFRGGYINEIDPRNFAAQVTYRF